MMTESDFVVLTPSQWSRDGFIESGGDPERIVVVPLGVEPDLYHPLREEERRMTADADGMQWIYVFVGWSHDKK